MANPRWKKQKANDSHTGHEGPRHDNVGPIKTRSWPGLPGKAQPKNRAYGFEKKKQSASEQGIC